MAALAVPTAISGAPPDVRLLRMGAACTVIAVAVSEPRHVGGRCTTRPSRRPADAPCVRNRLRILDDSIASGGLPAGGIGAATRVRSPASFLAWRTGNPARRRTTDAATRARPHPVMAPRDQRRHEATPPRGPEARRSFPGPERSTHRDEATGPAVRGCTGGAPGRWELGAWAARRRAVRPRLEHPLGRCRSGGTESVDRCVDKSPPDCRDWPTGLGSHDPPHSGSP